MGRRVVSSGSPYEGTIGFSRAVRTGNMIAVSGTAPIGSDGSTAHRNDVYGQTKCCLEIIKGAIEQLGGSLEHVIRTRLMLKNISKWEDAARAHGEFFAGVNPASTIVEVSGLIQPDWLVEIEADCVIEEGGTC